MSAEDVVDELAGECRRRAVERLFLETGKEPTGGEVMLLVLQAQVALLTTLLLEEDEELIMFWEGVLDTIRNGKSNGTA